MMLIMFGASSDVDMITSEKVEDEDELATPDPDSDPWTGFMGCIGARQFGCGHPKRVGAHDTALPGLALGCWSTAGPPEGVPSAPAAGCGLRERLSRSMYEYPPSSLDPSVR